MCVCVYVERERERRGEIGRIFIANELFSTAVPFARMQLIICVDVCMYVCMFV